MLTLAKSLAGNSSTITANAELVGTESTNVTTVTSQGEIEDDGAPSTKKICNPKEQQAQVQCSIWGYFDEMCQLKILQQDQQPLAMMQTAQRN